jgi:hypothetical protein
MTAAVFTEDLREAWRPQQRQQTTIRASLKRMAMFRAKLRRFATLVVYCQDWRNILAQKQVFSNFECPEYHSL